jgi:hypothetical protein
MSTKAKAAPAKKKITQETFDDVVRENVDEFDMSREDAIADAITQFETQGVDLSEIITKPRVTFQDADEPVHAYVSRALSILFAMLPYS